MCCLEHNFYILGEEMIDWKLLSNLVCRAWPLLIIGIFLIAHYLVLKIFFWDFHKTNKIIGAVCQILGSGILLISINNNLLVIEKNQYLV